MSNQPGFVALFFLLLFSSGALAEWNFAPKAQINYRVPPRTYARVEHGDLVVFVEQQLQNEDPVLAKRALARLEAKRTEAIGSLPAATQAALRKIPFYLMYGPKAAGGGRANGLRYFPEASPERNNWEDPNWKNVIVVHSAENYVRITDFWALKALAHELAHAYHLQHWPPNLPELVQAWKNAVNRGLYRNVVDENGKTHEEAYPRVNALEYFAELSAMTFVGCNYFPHNRAELEAYDPEGARLVRKLWGLAN